jgi:ABC-type dipeptide/oligopeptide/nickel transport system permease component
MLIILGAILFYAVSFMPTYGQFKGESAVELILRYFEIFGGVIQGGDSDGVRYARGIANALADRYPYTLIIAVGGTAVATVLGILLGIISAINHNNMIDKIIMVGSLITASVPLFFLALIFLIVFTLYLRILPSGGLTSWKGYIMPIFTLGLPAVGIITRTARSAMLDVINQDYIRASRARGIPERVVIYYHAFKNTLIPILTTVGLRFGELLAGTVLVEQSFAIPGIGRYLLDSITEWDTIKIIASVLVLATTFLVINVVIDVLYALVDARVRLD